MSRRKKRARSRVKDYLVYLFARSVVGLGQALSIEQSYALADLLAWFFHRFDKRHHAVGMENLRLEIGRAHV